MRSKAKVLVSGETDNKQGNDTNVIWQQAAVSQEENKGDRGRCPCDISGLSAQLQASTRLPASGGRAHA